MSENGKSLDMALTGVETFRGLVAVRLAEDTEAGKSRQFFLIDNYGNRLPLPKLAESTYGIRTPGGRRYTLVWQ